MIKNDGFYIFKSWWGYYWPGAESSKGTGRKALQSLITGQKGPGDDPGFSFSGNKHRLVPVSDLDCNQRSGSLSFTV